MQIQNIPAPDTYPVPDKDACMALWHKYAMPEHIQAHCMRVCDVAEAIAVQAAECEAVPQCTVPLVRAIALLHDLGKIYCIEHKGSHSQLGAVWAMAETDNPLIAQGILYHVCWPFEFDVVKYFQVLTVLYADKRVRHNQVVSLKERFADLFKRYAVNSRIEAYITKSKQQAQTIEEKLSRLMEVDLNACTFNSRGLVS